MGATRYYNDLASYAAQLPIIGNKVNADLTDHVARAALDGLFMKLAVQEKLIRNNPASSHKRYIKTTVEQIMNEHDQLFKNHSCSNY